MWKNGFFAALRVSDCIVIREFFVAITVGKGLIIDRVKAFNELAPESYSQLYMNDLCFFVIQYNRSCSDLLTIVFDSREITNVGHNHCT